MIKSMTGYGQAVYSSKGNIIISVELKSVNLRYRDINVRLPSILSPLERKFKKTVESVVERGKIDCCVNVDTPAETETAYEINMPLAKSYICVLRKLKEELQLEATPTIADIVAADNIIYTRKLEGDEITWEELSIPTDQALKAFDEMRKSEGRMLCDDIKGRLSNIMTMTDTVSVMQPEVVRNYREKLKKRVAILSEGMELDESRLIQEVAVMADRSDITEEVVRLNSHISQFSELLETGPGAVGRKLDFLLQEMNREVNTIGSKGNDSEIARQVVDMKAEIERIKEQVQNIE